MTVRKLQLALEVGSFEENDDDLMLQTDGAMVIALNDIGPGIIDASPYPVGVGVDLDQYQQFTAWVALTAHLVHKVSLDDDRRELLRETLARIEQAFLVSGETITNNTVEVAAIRVVRH